MSYNICKTLVKGYLPSHGFSTCQEQAMFSCGPWVVLAIGAVLIGMAPPSVLTIPLGGPVAPKKSQKSNGIVDIDAVLQKVMMDFVQMLERQKTSTSTARTIAARRLPPEPPRAQFLREAGNYVVEKVVTPGETTVVYPQTLPSTSSKIVIQTTNTEYAKTTLGISTPHSYFTGYTNKYRNSTYSTNMKINTPKPTDLSVTPNVTETAFSFGSATTSTKVPSIFTETGNVSTLRDILTEETHFSRKPSALTSRIFLATSSTSSTFAPVTDNTLGKLLSGEISRTTISLTTRSDKAASTMPTFTAQPVLNNTISATKGGFTLPSLTIGRSTLKSSSVTTTTSKRKVDVTKAITPSLVTKPREILHTGSDDRSHNRRNNTTRQSISPVCVFLTVFLLIGRTIF